MVVLSFSDSQPRQNTPLPPLKLLPGDSERRRDFGFKSLSQARSPLTKVQPALASPSRGQHSHSIRISGGKICDQNHVLFDGKICEQNQQRGPFAGQGYTMPAELGISSCNYKALMRRPCLEPAPLGFAPTGRVPQHDVGGFQRRTRPADLITVHIKHNALHLRRQSGNGGHHQTQEWSLSPRIDAR